MKSKKTLQFLLPVIYTAVCTLICVLFFNILYLSTHIKHLTLFFTDFAFSLSTAFVTLLVFLQVRKMIESGKKAVPGTAILIITVIFVSIITLWLVVGDFNLSELPYTALLSAIFIGFPVLLCGAVCLAVYLPENGIYARLSHCGGVKRMLIIFPTALGAILITGFLYSTVLTLLNGNMWNYLGGFEVFLLALLVFFSFAAGYGIVRSGKDGFILKNAIYIVCAAVFLVAIFNMPYLTEIICSTNPERSIFVGVDDVAVKAISSVLCLISLAIGETAGLVASRCRGFAPRSA